MTSRRVVRMVPVQTKVVTSLQLCLHSVLCFGNPVSYGRHNLLSRILSNALYFMSNGHFDSMKMFVYSCHVWTCRSATISEIGIQWTTELTNCKMLFSYSSDDTSLCNYLFRIGSAQLI